jgi:DNA-binding response OmpR family regulator
MAHLLVVEDEPDVRDLLIEMLHEAGFSAEGTGSVREAEQRLAGGGFDLVVLDLLLPDGNGAAVLGRLRDNGHAIPVLVCTGDGDHRQHSHLLDEGAGALLVKPFSGEALVAGIRGLLGRRGHAPAPTLRALQ